VVSVAGTLLELVIRPSAGNGSGNGNGTHADG
jgi:hypothetical protein